MRLEGDSMSTRRSFFQDATLLTALVALARKEGYAQPDGEKVSRFWDAYFAEATRDPTQVSKGGTDGDMIDPSKKVQLIHATPTGLRYPDTIPDAELRSDANDVVVTVNPGHFRPSPDDHTAIRKSKGCQVRLDWFQKQPLVNFIAPMAWVGLASWGSEKPTKDKTGKSLSACGATSVNPCVPVLPGLKDLDFRDPNDPDAPVHNEVILMGGSGRLALNVRAVRVNQRLRTVLDRSVRYSSIVAPFFGFAPLAIPALKAFTDLLGAVFNHEAVIMNSLPVQVLATRDAKNAPHAVNSVKIVDGDFLAVPGDQTQDLKAAFDKLRVDNGWLVHQDADPKMSLEDRAKDNRVPKVTYMSMGLKIEPLADVIKRKAQGA
jgi:hypothetical protein